jgi:hypothetical protein
LAQGVRLSLSAVVQPSLWTVLVRPMSVFWRVVYWLADRIGMAGVRVSNYAKDRLEPGWYERWQAEHGLGGGA